MPGRKPKPRNLKLLLGNPGKRPLPDAGPVPPEGEIVCPDFVKYRAKELWEEYAPALIAMETLTVVDVPNFAAWCVMMAEFEKKGGEVKSSDIAQMRLLASSLGMDAGSRAKLGASGKKKTVDPADAFFKPKAS